MCNKHFTFTSRYYTNCVLTRYICIIDFTSDQLVSHQLLELYYWHKKYFK